MNKKILIDKIKFIFKLYILKDRQLKAYKKWIAENPNEEKRYNYNLNEDSVIFDVGGYLGEFSEIINTKFKSQIYLFEPFPDFYKIIFEKFKNQENIKCFDFALSNFDGEMKMENKGLETSLIGNDKLKQSKNVVKVINIINFIKSYNIVSIDLMKLNVEGSEYEILEEIIAAGFINKIKNIQVQFHKTSNRDEKDYTRLRRLLKKTHHVTYEYFMIWENWCLNNK